MENGWRRTTGTATLSLSTRHLLKIMAKMDALRAEEHREAAGELPTRLIYDGERYGSDRPRRTRSSRLADMDKYREMVSAGGPTMDDDLSMATDEHSLGVGHEGYYGQTRPPLLCYVNNFSYIHVLVPRFV